MQRLKSQNQREILYKSSLPCPLKQFIQTRTHMSTSQCGSFAKHCPNVYVKKGDMIFILTVLLLPPAPCRGDAVFHCENESILFGLPKLDTTRNQWLSYIYNTVPEQFNPNIRVCAVVLHSIHTYSCRYIDIVAHVQQWTTLNLK